MHVNSHLLISCKVWVLIVIMSYMWGWGGGGGGGGKIFTTSG